MALNKKFFVKLSSIEYGIEEIMIRDDDDSRESEPNGANLMRNRFSFYLMQQIEYRLILKKQSLSRRKLKKTSFGLAIKNSD